jgi:hypothetical protein
VDISARWPAVVTESFRGFLLSLQGNDGDDVCRSTAVQLPPVPAGQNTEQGRPWELWLPHWAALPQAAGDTVPSRRWGFDAAPITDITRGRGGRRRL